MNPALIRVLVVDDDEFVRLNLLAFLEDEGFHVLSSASGEEALQVLETQEVDVTVVDLRLPGIDGNSFIGDAHLLQPRARFVIHTGSIDYTLPEAVKRVGVRPEHVFHKPVTEMETLRQAIEGLAAESRAESSDTGNGQIS